MCWNPEISLSTFVFGIAAIIIGYINKEHDIKWALFYTTIVSMQLIEFFIWKNLGSKHINKILSIIAFVLIMIQPIAAGMLIENKSYMMIYYILYVLWLVVYITSSSPIKWITQKAKNGHLSWLWLNPAHDLLILTWTVFIICALLLSKGSLLSRIICVTALALFTLVSWWYYKTQEFTWGSVYCSFINMIFLFIIGKSFWIHYCRA